MRRASSNLMWTPRSIFVITLLGCIAVASASNYTYEVDSRFGSGSANLARDFYRIKGQLPHPALPDHNITDNPSSWAKNYGIGLAKIVGPGFAIAIICLLAGIIYGIFKLIRMCVCGSRRDPDEAEEQRSFFTWQKLVPTGIYAFCWVWLFAGMIIGLMNNPKFTTGVQDMSADVVNVGTDALNLGDGLIDSVNSLAALVPISITEITDQIAGIPQVADNVQELGVDVNSTATQVHNITAKIAAIDAGNTAAVSSLYTQLLSIDNSSTQVIGNVADLTTQISDKLRNSLNDTLAGLNDNMESIDSTVADITATAQDVVDQADKLVNKVTKYTDDAKSYDQSRQKAVTALFSLIIVVTVLISAGFIFKVKAIFNVVSAFGFVFLFFLWLSGAIHFLLGMVLHDACPVVDVVVQGLLPKNSTAGDVLNGCLYEGKTVLESMNLEDKYNFTQVFDHKNDFSSFTDFAKSFNFSSIDDYFSSIQVLYSYNLTEVADNMTVANYGWNESKIYDLLYVLNQQTDPLYYDESNYTQADPSAYTPPKNQTVYDAQEAITVFIQANTTIYDKLATAKAELYSAQDDMNVLLANYTEFQNRYDGIKADVNETATTNITNCINIIDGLENNVTNFFTLGNCSFLGDTYTAITWSMCSTMQPAIDLLTVAQFLAGIALIPMVIVAEILSFRITKNTRIAPCGDEDDVYDDGESGTRGSGKNCDYAVALTETKGAATPPPVRHSITATIATSQGDDSTPEILRGDYSGPVEDRAVTSTDSHSQEEGSNYE